MKVEYRPLQDSILDACKHVASTKKEETFSALEVAESINTGLSQTLERLAFLEKNEWIVRLGSSGGDILHDELWCLHEQTLTPGKLYEVLGIEADFYRILTDPSDLFSPNDPVLFSPTGFTIREPEKPNFWITEVGSDGELYCYPPEWLRIGFWEDFHDGVDKVIEQFWNDVQKYYPWTWVERCWRAGVGPR